MFDLTTILDISFLLLAIYFFPGLPSVFDTPGETKINHPAPLSSTPETHQDTPLPSPTPILSHAPSTLSVPQIILHPSPSTYPSSIPVSLLNRPIRPTHKTKAVSFSLSSMSDILPSSASADRAKRLFRPPTPWMRGPASPSELAGLASGDDTTPMPSPMTARQGSGGERRGPDGSVKGKGKGSSLDVMVLDSQAGSEEVSPMFSPKICNRDVTDTMGIKKSWLMA